MISKNIFVFGMPFHSNAGDQAQSFCIELWLKENYPGYTIRWFDAENMNKTEYSILFQIKKHLKAKDLIFLHSGYHTTDLYMLEEKLQRKVIQAFPQKKIIILPQTINYETEKEKENAKRIYNAHNDILLFCRDSVSYQKAQNYFFNCKLVLFPDIVTTLIGKYRFNYNRKGILLCLRNDKEAAVQAETKEQIVAELLEVDQVDITDTTLDIDPKFFIDNRKQVLENLWSEYAKYRVIITDRYHGTIFSLIAGTPVIVIPSSDHKLKSGVDWFPIEYKSYVCYLSNLDRIIDEVKRVYKNQYDYRLQSYFQEQYYDKLKEYIEGE